MHLLTTGLHGTVRVNIYLPMTRDVCTYQYTVQLAGIAKFLAPCKHLLQTMKLHKYLIMVKKFVGYCIGFTRPCANL